MTAPCTSGCTVLSCRRGKDLFFFSSVFGFFSLVGGRTVVIPLAATSSHPLHHKLSSCLLFASIVASAALSSGAAVCISLFCVRGSSPSSRGLLPLSTCCAIHSLAGLGAARRPFAAYLLVNFVTCLRSQILLFLLLLESSFPRFSLNHLSLLPRFFPLWMYLLSFWLIVELKLFWL